MLSSARHASAGSAPESTLEPPRWNGWSDREAGRQELTGQDRGNRPDELSGSTDGHGAPSRKNGPEKCAGFGRAATRGRFAFSVDASSVAGPADARAAPGADDQHPEADDEQPTQSFAEVATGTER